MRHSLRLWLPSLALAALVSAGCLLVSGQFVITFSFAEHGYDPLTVTGPGSLSGVPVDLNTVSAYNDHKSDLKDVVDIALVGKLTNNSASASEIEVWMVANPGGLLTTDSSVRANGVRVWGPVTLAAGQARQIGWNESARLFAGRKALVDEIRGDGRFDLYALASGGYSFRLDQGALLAVIAAGK